MKKNILIIIGVIFLVGFAVYNNTAEPAVVNEEAPKPHFLTPSFQLTELNDPDKLIAINSRSLSKPIIINFWASWCGPCHLEAPDLKKLHDAYGDQIDFYGMNATNTDSVEEAKGFVEKYDLTFPMLMDFKGDVSKLYQIQGYPTTFFIDQQGAIRDIALGAITYEQMENKVRLILD